MSTSWHTVVLAAQRPGIVNPLAAAAGVSHKCLIPMAGRALIEHVLLALQQSPEVDHITVSIDQPETLDQVPLVNQLREAGRLSVIRSSDNLFASVALALTREEHFPSIITTADNVLLRAEMLQHFTGQLLAEGTDAGIAMTRKQVLLDKYPDGQRRFHRFADGEWSNCNLYALMSPAALRGASIFKTGGQFVKSPLRVLKAFGVWNAIGYRFAWYKRDRAMQRLGNRFGISVTGIDMPFPEAPIDVDNQRSQRLAGEILAARQQQ